MKTRKNKRLVTECGEVKDLLAEHYHNVFQELVISTNLSNLHATLCNYQGFEYRVHGFPKLFKSSLVNEMVPLDKGPINVGLQEFTSICMEHCGESLRSCYKKLTIKQIISVVYQVLLSLAAAEATFEYEHRDLHLGNIMVRSTKNPTVHFVVASREYKVDTEGKRAFIIDNTFARMRIGSHHYYTNLTDRLATLARDAKNPNKVQSDQDKIYVGMYYSACGNWAKWMPRTNLEWMSFIIHRFLKNVQLNKDGDDRFAAELEALHHQIKSCKTLKSVLNSIDKK
ncbi:PREDICTED: putative serine/threonine-protein kinase haspin homolog [Rhagoletis zephyria]|uniref:putative serine/threonine-protein kinase haspin homolog n=1 Tax=Rhagoletis zephyria TaxID=28612 RepID=UPI0008116128|nr:PREDICTED: putative serine/threonine-protein kinase haspin homolog [Rhagoletis zephyria]